MRLSFPCVLAVAALTIGCTAMARATPSGPEGAASMAPVAAACETGIFRKDGASFIAITRSNKGYDYSFSDGTVGNANDASAVVACGAGAVRVRGQENWAKVAVAETNTVFVSDGVMLAGRLMAPPGADAHTPLVVIAHGSEEGGWIDRARDPYQMVGRGIAVFVYDKRGTGLSKGAYTQNLPQLGNDLVAAAQEAKRLARDQYGGYGRFGLFGLSQGGWVAPLAAVRAKAEFIGIGYGLAVDIAEQDAAQVSLELRERGLGEDVVAKGRMLSDTTARLVKSGYKDGLDELAAAQAQFGKEPWFARIKGGYTGVVLGMSVDDLRTRGIPHLDKLGVDWSLEPVQILAGFDVPQLWAFAGEDRQAPIALTLERLSALRKQGKDISIYIFPDTEHGMWNYVQAADLSRKHTRIAAGFYDLMADWARGGVEGRYGKAERR